MDLLLVRYVISPRGNGIDTHRVWEALYLGVIPVAERSALTGLYSPLPILLVDDLQGITKEFLDSEYPKYHKALEQPIEQLWRPYYYNLVESTRNKALEDLDLPDVLVRKRCWGPN